MAEKLIIQNFGPIRSVDMDIKRFMVLIGTQASGKSTVAKILSIFRSLSFVVHDSKDYLKYFRDYKINSYFTDSTVIQYTSDLYSVSYADKSWSITETITLTNLIKLDRERLFKVYNEIYKIEDTNPETQEAYVKRVFEDNWTRASTILNEQIYIPADRVLAATIDAGAWNFRDALLPPCLVEFLKHFERASNVLKEYEIPFLGIKYKLVNGENRIFHDEINSILLSEGSSGIQSLVPLQIVVQDRRNRRTARRTAFIVEEPELSLYPKAQREIVNFLVSSCNYGIKNDLFITTHSPYVLSCLNNLLFAHQTATKHPDKIDRINEIIKHDCQINPADFNAYFLAAGSAKQIFDNSIGLIAANTLDDVSEDIQGDYDRLMEIYRAKP